MKKQRSYNEGVFSDDEGQKRKQRAVSRPRNEKSLAKENFDEEM